MRVVLARSIVTLGAAFAAAACADQARIPTALSPITPSFNEVHSSSGTTLAAYKTAAGFNERRVDYDWSITKHVKELIGETDDGNMYMLPSTTDLEIPRGQIRWITYEIDAERKAGVTQTVQGVRGQICVTNTGNTPTQNLKIVDVVQIARTSDHYVSYKEVPIQLDDKSVLAPGENHCYGYDILLTPIAGARYRNTAHITISNYQDHASEYGPCDDKDDSDELPAKSEVKPVSFSIPSTVSEGPAMDADAIVHDGMFVDNEADRTGPCAEHFYMYWCTTNTAKNEYHLTGPGTVEYRIDIHNFFGCDDSYDLPNVAELIEGGVAGSGVRRTSKASLHIRSDACEPQPGCVEEDDYWAKVPYWPGFYAGHDFIRNSYEFFDSHRTWQQTLANKRKDIYSELAREYVGANLNRSNKAAMPVPIRASFASAAHYFSLEPAERALTRETTLKGWKETLASYNHGTGGIPRCSQKDHEKDHDKDDDHDGHKSSEGGDHS